jgi:long-chain acyl-CoA synthetase
VIDTADSEDSVSGQRGAEDDLELRLAGLLARIARRPLAEVRPEAELELDLGLDSLGRVELAMLLEEELGHSLSDETMASLRTVGELLTALAASSEVRAVEPLPTWPRSAPVRLARSLLHELLLFPLLRWLCRPWRIEGAERLRHLKGPVLLIANHTSHLDAPLVLALLPAALRRHTAVAAAADYFFERQPLATLAPLALGAFPFHRQGAVATSLTHCGHLAADGYSLLIFPEGTRSPSGALQPFKPGIGLLARELGLPVLPIHLAGPHAILPKGRSLPRPGPLTVTVGQPIRLDRRLSPAQATAVLEAAMRDLAAE